MMVKNEVQVISRALHSALPWIDYWVICDTGSTDGTQDAIRTILADIPGELHEVPWVNFGHNRSEVIRLAKGKADYLLVMDADMILNVTEEFRHTLRMDYYEIRYTGALDYAQNMLFANHFDWQYYGVTHEYIHAPEAKRWAFLPQISLTHFADGSGRSDKFTRDIALLTEGLKDEPQNARYHFYMAQSYRDLHKWKEALEWYRKRVAFTEAWIEETWYALYQIADMKRLLNHPWPEVLAAYQAAIDFRPHRYEPVYAIVRHYREAGEYQQGYMYSSFAIQGLSYPDKDLLFVEKPVYDYLLLLEHAACALACGRITETINAVNLMVKAKSIPQYIYNKGIEARGMALQHLYGPAKELNGEEPIPEVVVIVPYHDAGKWLDKCLACLRVQDTKDFRVILIDDASNDISADVVLPAELNTTFIRNTQRKGALYNFHHAITQYCAPNDIIVCMDGDDRLSCPDAISFIRKYYMQHDCWVLYGQYADSDGNPGLSAPFSSPNDFLTLRTCWRTSHIRTFRAGLFQRIREQDPELTCFRDDDGQWLTAAVDAAMMFPLLEMAGFSRTHFNEKVLYTYNLENQYSHHNHDIVNQDTCYHLVRQRRPFAQVDSFRPAHKPQFLPS